MSAPDTTLLNVLLTPELLVAIANQARDKFEWLDSYPAQPGEPFDGSDEAMAELLEELVRIAAPAHVTQLASHMEGDDPRPAWRIRHEDQPNPLEYDEDEPVAHIVQAIDRIAQVPATPVVNNMLMVADSALARACDESKAAHEADTRMRLLHIRDSVSRLLDELA